MAKQYVSKYPAIVMDKSANSANESLKKTLTVEEYYDFLHHTHDASSLVVDEDGMTYDQMQTTITELKQTINDLNTIIKKLESDNTELKRSIENINKEISNMASVSDWDVETPGNQDINGNDLGTLMGFTMTEIAE